MEGIFVEVGSFCLVCVVLCNGIFYSLSEGRETATMPAVICDFDVDQVRTRSDTKRPCADDACDADGTGTLADDSSTVYGRHLLSARPFLSPIVSWQYEDLSSEACPPKGRALP